MAEFLHGDLTYYLRGIGFRVHKTLKGGHKEKVYEDAFCLLLDKEGVAHLRQPLYNICYKGKQVGKYRPDLVCGDGKVAVEFKAVPSIIAIHKAQALSYVAVINADLGLVMNFGASSFQSERLPNFLKDRPPFQWQTRTHPDSLYPEITDHVLQTVHEVHYTLGPGFLHQVYRRATRIELGLQRVNFVYLKELPILFEGHRLDVVPTRLFHIEKCLLLATIAVTAITTEHTEKIHWAMKTTDCRLGVIANFYPSKLDIRFFRNNKS